MNRMKTLCYWPWAVDLQQVTYLKESTSWMVRTYNIYHDSIPNYMTVPIYCLFFGLLSYDWFVCDVPFFQIWAHPPRTKKRFCKSNVSMPKIPCFRNYGEVDEIFRQNENLILMQGSFKNTYIPILQYVKFECKVDILTMQLLYTIHILKNVKFRLYFCDFCNIGCV